MMQFYSQDPRTQFNEEAVKQLGEADRVIVCGQAMSHCVNFTVRDILGYWKEHGIDASKMVLLSDGKRFFCQNRP